MSAGSRRDLESELVAAQREIARLQRRDALDSGYDSLSGLVDLRSFCAAAEVELGRAARHGRDVALALIDLDGMGEINSRHSRAAGDEVLAETGRVLQSFLRAHDLACRSWADEFALLLPETDQPGAAACCERILLELAATAAGPVPALSATAGVAAADGSGSLFELVARASGALGDARACGTGRIGVAREAGDGHQAGHRSR